MRRQFWDIKDKWRKTLNASDTYKKIYMLKCSHNWMLYFVYIYHNYHFYHLVQTYRDLDKIGEHNRIVIISQCILRKLKYNQTLLPVILTIIVK